MSALFLLAEVGTFDGLDPYDLVWLAAAIVTVGSAGFALYRWVWKPGCARMKKYDAAVDLILGYGPVLDPATGDVLKPPTPPLAMRFSVMESTVTTLAAAEASRAEADVLREQSTAQLVDIASRIEQHETWQVEHVADVERMHTEMWDAIVTLGGSRPAGEGGA